VLAKIRAGLGRTRNRIDQALRQLSGDSSAQDCLNTLEEILFTADVGPLVGELLEDAQAQFSSGTLRGPQEIATWLQTRLENLAGKPPDPPLPKSTGSTQVILIAGVNGCGKTTSLAKLIHWLQSRGETVVVAAGDTYRAAAVEQLATWCQRLNTPLVTGKDGADPASVAHDGAELALREKADYFIVDTAGRLHTQKNLMAELDKVGRVLNRKIPGAPHHTLLVLDATTGQNAVRQAKHFGECLPLTGIILSKLDGTAKGGAVLSIHQELRLPVLFVGLGESVEDWEVFQPKEFVAAMLQAK
jgi:fused signal recognition particle receptor